MDKVMDETIKNLQSISDSLHTLSTEGMKIIDTYAEISTPANFKSDLLVAIIGTIIGGIITIILFKLQEKMRVRQELELDFFKDYKKIYEEFIKDFSNFKSWVQDIKSLQEIDKTMYDIIQDVKRIYVKGEKELKNLVTVSISTYNSITKIENHIKNNPMIMKKYKKKKYELVSDEIFLINNYIKDIDYCLDTFKTNSYFNYTKDEMCSRYKENIEKLKDKYDKLERLEQEINEIHANIELKFLGRYFRSF